MEIARSDHTRRWALLALPLSGMSGCLSQHEVFENEISIAGRQWSIAGTTFDFLNGRFRSGFCFDDLIDGIAVRAKVQWLVGRHKCPQTDWFTSGDMVARLFGKRRFVGCVHAERPGRPLRVASRCSMSWLGGA